MTPGDPESGENQGILEVQVENDDYLEDEFPKEEEGEAVEVPVLLALELRDQLSKEGGDEWETFLHHVHLQATVDTPSVYSNYTILWQHLFTIPEDQRSSFLFHILEKCTSLNNLLFGIVRSAIACLDDAIQPRLSVIEKAIEANALEVAPGDMSVEDTLTLITTSLENEPAVDATFIGGLKTVLREVYLKIGLPTNCDPTIYHSIAINDLMDIMTPVLLSEMTSLNYNPKHTAALTELEKVMGLKSLRKHVFLLSAGAKKLFFCLALTQHADDLIKLNVVCSRETCLQDSLVQITAALQTATTTVPLLQLFPFFTCTYGTKRVNGVRVEEAEGHGPRKEWFSLIAHAFCSLFTIVPGCKSMSILKDFRMHKRCQYVLEAGGIGKVAQTGHRVRFHDPRRAGFEHATLFTHSVLSDDCILLENQQDAPHAALVKALSSGTEWTVEDMLQGHQNQSWTVQLEERSQPVLQYIKGSETFWLNEALSRDRKDHLYLLGIVLGSALVNQSTLNVPINSLLFQYLLDMHMHSTPGGLMQRTLTQLQSDVMLLDPSLAKTFFDIEKLKLQDFKALLHADGLPLETTMSEYIHSALKERLVENLEWQLIEILKGFQSVVPTDIFFLLHVSYDELCEMICGRKSSEEIDLAATFRISIDTEMQLCVPFKKTFWKIVDEFNDEMTRTLIAFVTGVSQLPLPQTEVSLFDE